MDETTIFDIIRLLYGVREKKKNQGFSRFFLDILAFQGYLRSPFHF